MRFLVQNDDVCKLNKIYGVTCDTFNLFLFHISICFTFCVLTNFMKTNKQQ